MNKVAKDFLNVKNGDIVYAYDECSREGDVHKVKVNSIENNKENACEDNPDGKTLYVTDLDCLDEDGKYDTDEYIGVVTLNNFCGLNN